MHTQRTKVTAVAQSNQPPVDVIDMKTPPKVQVDTDTETAKKVLRLIEAIDDHDDVQNVYSNLHLTEKLMAEVAKE